MFRCVQLGRNSLKSCSCLLNPLHDGSRDRHHVLLGLARLPQVMYTFVNKGDLVAVSVVSDCRCRRYVACTQNSILDSGDAILNFSLEEQRPSVGPAVPILAVAQLVAAVSSLGRPGSCTLFKLLSESRRDEDLEHVGRHVTHFSQTVNCLALKSSPIL